MLSLHSIRKIIAQQSLHARIKLGQPVTSWQLCVLAMIGGLFSAFLIVLFLWCIESIQLFLLNDVDNYTSLDNVSRLLLPFVGIFCIFIFARLTGYKYLRSGIPFVLHRLKVAYGIIPFRNSLNQFFGGIAALASGFSVGKEGPSVHLGAAVTGYLGRVLNLPYNSVRTLCACGVAAGIAACFNTPIAAVIFVMEVILREYKVHMFIPIMLAAIIGSLVTSTILGPAHAFEYFNIISLEFEHYPTIVLLGIALGALAAAFNQNLVFIIGRYQQMHIIRRFVLAATITGCVGFLLPQAMGTEASALSVSLSTETAIFTLAGLLLAKCVLTAVTIGLGIPGGVIGPILGIGAIAGALTANLTGGMSATSPHFISDFALMGMAGFMAATLNAPLAALLAVVELSNQLDIVLPAMLVITSACLSAGQLFNNRSIFVMQLNVQQLAYRKPPLENSLQRIGVLGVFNPSIFVLEQEEQSKGQINLEQVLDNYDYLVLRIPSSEGDQFYWNESVDTDTEDHRFRQHKLTPVCSRETLVEAYKILQQKRCGGVYIYDEDPDQILGIITFAQIRRYLVEGKLV